ncbi:MAG: STAS domain-containing protein [Butyrivibrio sp.]|nr:STAS domain-containing protein [Butyrivibrio sp.]
MEFVYKAPQRIDSMNAPKVQEELIGEIQKVLSENADKIVIDMSETSYLSSAGLRIMTIAFKRAKGAGASFALRGVSEMVQDLFDVTGLSGYLPME